MKRLLIGTMALTTGLLVGCEKEEEKNYDEATLAEYRAALPANGALAAPIASAASASAFAPGDPAAYPAFIGPIATAINGTIGATIEVVNAIAQTEPTVFDSVERKFLWGPHDNGDTALAGDTIALFIHDNGEAASDDFRYEFALLRGMSTDVATMVPVIYGGGEPADADETTDYGAGILLYDFEANYQFEEANDPSHGVLDRGRFLSIFAKGPDATEADVDVTLVVSAFRNFVPKDDAGAALISADYFYGGGLNTVTGGRFDFVDFEFTADTDDTGPLEENLGVHLALVNLGAGRAEANVTGGDYGATSVEVVECWDASLNYNHLSIATNGNPTPIATEGNSANCISQSLANVPDLQDIDPALMAALNALATGGIPNS